MTIRMHPRTHARSVASAIAFALLLTVTACQRIGAIATRGCVVVVAQTLDPDEADFPFHETVRLKSLEGGQVVETDEAARDRYLDALHAEQGQWRDKLLGRGAKFLTLRTDMDPVAAVRAIVEASL